MSSACTSHLVKKVAAVSIQLRFARIGHQRRIVQIGRGLIVATLWSRDHGVINVVSSGDKHIARLDNQLAIGEAWEAFAHSIDAVSVTRAVLSSRTRSCRVLFTLRDRFFTVCRPRRSHAIKTRTVVGRTKASNILTSFACRWIFAVGARAIDAFTSTVAVSTNHLSSHVIEITF